MLTRQDKIFKFDTLMYLDFKHIEMDRVLMALFERLRYKGFPSRLERPKNFELTVDSFLTEFLDHPEWFKNFNDQPDVIRKWLETHLLDMVHRGKSNQAVAGPRPLHGFVYRFRNQHHARDYGAAPQLYEMLAHARHGTGQHAIEHLESFFFAGYDRRTMQMNNQITLDVETQAILRLMNQVRNDAADHRKARESFPPLCIGQPDLMAEDIQRLLLYQGHMPRTVLVDALKTLLAFHLGLYLLRLFKLLPLWLRQRRVDSICTPERCPVKPRSFQAPQGNCPYQIGLFVDISEQPGTPQAELAEHSAEAHLRRMQPFLTAYLTLRKLGEFAKSSQLQGKLDKPSAGFFSISDLMPLLNGKYERERDVFFEARLQNWQQNNNAEELEDEIASILALPLSQFEKYIEVLAYHQVPAYSTQLIKLLDSLLLKNQPGALMHQGKGSKARRRFVLDSHLLEVLVQLAVLHVDANGAYLTREIQLDAFIDFLRERYGIYLDRLPPDATLQAPDTEVYSCLEANRHALVQRLQEIGYYRNLSDAYLTQTLRPRYAILPSGAPMP